MTQSWTVSILAMIVIAAAIAVVLRVTVPSCPTGEVLEWREGAMTKEERLAELDRLIAIAERKRECLRRRR